MGPAEVAKRLGVSGTTIKNYTAQHPQYFSPGATPAAGGARSYTETDLQVLLEIRRLLEEGRTHKEIADILPTINFGEVEIEPDDPPVVEGGHEDDQPAGLGDSRAVALRSGAPVGFPAEKLPVASHGVDSGVLVELAELRSQSAAQNDQINELRRLIYGIGAGAFLVLLLLVLVVLLT